jgi:hypothetical protein
VNTSYATEVEKRTDDDDDNDGVDARAREAGDDRWIQLM